MKIKYNFGELRDGRTALVLDKAGHTEYAIVRRFDENAPMGEKWDSGLYFQSLNPFLEKMSEIQETSMARKADMLESYLDNYEEDAVNTIETLGYSKDDLCDIGLWDEGDHAYD